MSPAKRKTAKKPAPRKKHKKKAGPARPARAPRRPRQHPGAEQAAPAENPRARALARRIAELVLEKKGLDVLILDVRGKTSYADYFVLASGESDRQVTAMGDHVQERLREDGTRPVGVEGEDTGNWVLLDYGEVVAHLFFTEVRAFYDLEGLWADAPREQVA